MKIKLSQHAKIELERRGISQTMVESVLERPQQIIEGDPEGIKIYQSQVDFSGKVFLLGVFVSGEGNDRNVVTVYRTSKIKKYWRRIT